MIFSKLVAQELIKRAAVQALNQNKCAFFFFLCCFLILSKATTVFSRYLEEEEEAAPASVT